MSEQTKDFVVIQRGGPAGFYGRLQEIVDQSRNLRQHGPAPEDLNGLSEGLDRATKLADDMLSEMVWAESAKPLGVTQEALWSALDEYNGAVRSAFQCAQRDATHDVHGTTAYRTLADQLSAVLEKHHATWLEAKLNFGSQHA